AARKEDARVITLLRVMLLRAMQPDPADVARVAGKRRQPHAAAFERRHGARQVLARLLHLPSDVAVELPDLLVRPFGIVPPLDEPQIAAPERSLRQPRAAGHGETPELMHRDEVARVRPLLVLIGPQVAA